MSGRTLIPQVKNVILLSFDALRADHLSCFGYPRSTSPTIDQIASENIIFTNAFSPSCHTREAVPSFLSGLYPDKSINRKYHLTAPTIAHYLSEAQFQTAAFHSNPFLSRAYGYNDDFDVFYDDLHIGKHPIFALLKRAIDKLRKRHYARASTINEKSLDWINDVESPFFVWNHYMDVHGPYEPPAKYQNIFRENILDQKEAQQLYNRAIDHPESITEADRETLIDLYDGEIRYLNDKIGDFIDQLRQRDLLKQTLIIITGDHGDAFGEHGYYEHPRHLVKELTHVPIILIHPSFESTQYSAFVSGLDIVPTILDTISDSHADLHGRSLFNTLTNPNEYEDRVVYSQARGEKNEASIIKFAARGPTGTCMIERDLQSETVRTSKAEDNALLQQLRDHSSSRVNYGSALEPEMEISTTVVIEDRLRALGYRE